MGDHLMKMWALFSSTERESSSVLRGIREEIDAMMILATSFSSSVGRSLLK